jgi:hypothetical protein
MSPGMMSERLSWQLAAASGILYVALGLARGGGGGGGAGVGDSRANIATQRGSGPASLVAFVGVLAAAIRRREGAQPWLANVTLAAGLITVTVRP